MFKCPHCHEPLTRKATRHGQIWICDRCNGRAANVSMLRRLTTKATVDSLWLASYESDGPQLLLCPACRNPMRKVEAPQRAEKIDVCRRCQLVWFDAHEFEALEPTPTAPLGSEDLRDHIAPNDKRELAYLQIDVLKEKDKEARGTPPCPDSLGDLVVSAIDLPVIHDHISFVSLPLATWILAGLVAIVSVLGFIFPDGIAVRLAVVPNDLLRLGGLTPITSFFVHANAFHLLVNVGFLITFGRPIEDRFGPARFLALVLAGTLFGVLFHCLGDPRSDVPLIGASGGVSGIVCFFALLYPRVQLGMMVHGRWIRLPAILLFVLWTLAQVGTLISQLLGYSETSALAHLGGFAIGIVLWFWIRPAPERSSPATD